MTGRITPKPVAVAEARAVFDRARARLAADRAAGRLTPETAALLDRLWGPEPTAEHRAA